jgi:hypothetical protein
MTCFRDVNKPCCEPAVCQYHEALEKNMQLWMRCFEDDKCEVFEDDSSSEETRLLNASDFVSNNVLEECFVLYSKFSNDSVVVEVGDGVVVCTKCVLLKKSLTIPCNSIVNSSSSELSESSSLSSSFSRAFVKLAMNVAAKKQ